MNDNLCLTFNLGATEVHCRALVFNFIGNLEESKMNKHMCAIIATIEGLRNLDNWPDSPAKAWLTAQRDSMAASMKDGLERPESTIFKSRHRLQYADPLGREISLFEWAVAKESVETHVEEWFVDGDSDIRVSTIWLGLNHGFFDTVQIFETMIFGIKDDPELKGYQERYGTLEEAEAGHKEAVKMVCEYITTRVKK